MEQLPKARLQAVVVGFILGLIVLGVAVSLKKPKSVRLVVVGLQLQCANHTPTVVPIYVSQAGIEQFQDPFNICYGDKVTWQKAGADDFIVIFPNGTPFDNETKFEPPSGQDSAGPAEGASQATPTGCNDYGANYYCKYTVSVKVGTKWLYFDPGGVVWK